MGPTASGKTALAEALAESTGAQLVNADAFQVYRDLDIVITAIALLEILGNSTFRLVNSGRGDSTAEIIFSF